MYHAGFIKTVIRILRCVSYHTSKLLVDKVCFPSPLPEDFVPYGQGLTSFFNPSLDRAQVPARFEDPGPRQAPPPHRGHVWS